MMLAKLFLPLIVFTISAFAQRLSHPMVASRADVASTPRAFTTAVDTIDVLAAMVQFQIDNDNGTSGNGQFDLSTPATVSFDSPPRNAQYFRDHLTFLANYYAKASKGQTRIRTTLIDTVYTLGSQMARYSPPKNGPNTVVGDLARDTWQRVDSSGKVADFSRYDCFVLFHAGVGRDVDVVATVGFDPAPRDIPSLYLGLNAFKSFYGQTYEGISVRNGFKITNTIVMPETETRELPATPTNVILRLGINGLLVASVGNYLGLPDLFDTNTGRSGIGRFGLMDGQAIFSFAGAFPPEPSAWEKYWLGWIQPITLSAGTNDIALPAASTDSARVYRVPISGSEYYLMENRNRDIAKNGQRVTLSYNNTIRTQTFLRDTTDFESFDVDALSGNVIDVEDLDWSIPGGVGRNNEFFDGGILIWHIDENIIAQGIATNGVNANPDRRGVDVEEADGSQDIGQQYGQLEAGSGSEEGTALDFWYLGNGSPVNKNFFSSISYPSSASNAGANSHITIKNFSARGARMTAQVMIGDNVSLLPGFPKQVGSQLKKPSLTVANLGSPMSPAIVVSTSRDASSRPSRNSSAVALAGQVYAWKSDGSPLLRNALFAWSGGQVPFAGSPYVGAPAITDWNSNGIPDAIVADANGILHVYQTTPRLSDSLAVEILAQPLAKRLTTSALVTDSAVAIGASRATLYIVSKRDGKLDSLLIANDTTDVVGLVALNPRTFVYRSAAGRIGSNVVSITSSIPASSGATSQGAGALIAGNFGPNNQLSFAYTERDGVLKAGGISFNTGEPINSSPALADIDGDGNRDIIVFAGNKIHAHNYAGASLDNFPKLVLAAKPISSNPVVADVDGDGDVDIVAVTEDGFVAAYDKNGTMAAGFPLQAGKGFQSVAAFAFAAAPLSVTNIGLAVASSEDGSVSAWQTASLGGNRQPQIPWGQYQRDAQHSGLAIEQISGSPISSAFFPKDRAYNWPNPVYNGKTFIRYFIKDNATVKIKILDLAGDLVTEFSGPGVGGVDNEVEWNVGDVQSGVYLARIEANGGGNNEVTIVKVAVVK